MFSQFPHSTNTIAQTFKKWIQGQFHDPCLYCLKKKIYAIVIMLMQILNVNQIKLNIQKDDAHKEAIEIASGCFCFK